jgi:hypothetical protein
LRQSVKGVWRSYVDQKAGVVGGVERQANKPRTQVDDDDIAVLMTALGDREADQCERASPMAIGPLLGRLASGRLFHVSALPCGAGSVGEVFR